MPRVRVPDEFDKGVVELAGTEPNENEMRVGAPREADVRVSDRYPRNAVVREDEDGRYVGVPERHAGPVRQFFADEYDASYSGEDDDSGEDAPEVDDSPLPDADDTESGHWRTVTGAIAEGQYDGALDTVAENDERDSVQQAVSQRQEEVGE